LIAPLDGRIYDQALQQNAVPLGRPEVTVDASDLDQVIEQYHRALGELTNGNPQLYKDLFSRRDDVTLANPFAPFGPVSRGWIQVAETITRAATHYTDGELVAFDNHAKYVTDQLAYIVEVEHFRAKVAGRADKASLALRVTSILRRENSEWKVVHRQADAITSARPPESVLLE
jgi:hypothetical protein